MAYPEPKDDRELDGLRRANRDEDQHWREKGWKKIEGGRESGLTQEPLVRDEERPRIGADFTRSPDDPSLVRDEQGGIRDDRADVLRGYGEPIPERNYPAAYDRDQLMNTDLNPMMEYPRHTTATYRILAIVLGLALFGLLIAAMYWGFLAPVRRSPERQKTGEIQQEKVQTTAGIQQFAAFVSRMNERR